MGRDVRVQRVGYHYISNRSIELRNAFVVKDDYLKFIELLSELSQSHGFSIESYTLLSHAYYLLIKTSSENLSAIMKLLNRRYSLYFNNKYGRNGALWEGRFKSTFMEDEGYLFYFIRHMEHLPKMTGIVLALEDYSYSTYRQFVGLDSRLRALESSVVFQRFNSIDEIKIFFMQEVNKEFIDNLVEILRKQEKQRKKEDAKKEKEVLELCDFLSIKQNDEERVEGMREAYRAGISQVKIADFLGLSQQAVSLKIQGKMKACVE